MRGHFVNALQIFTRQTITCAGKVFYTRILRQFFYREVAQNALLAEYQETFDNFTATATPKLLEPLQSAGRYLKPCLVHNDPWEENIGVDRATADFVAFDPSLMFAHKEYELRMWKPDIGEGHIKQYQNILRSTNQQTNGMTAISYTRSSLALPIYNITRDEG
ncbi:hypothetical protein AJ80_02798 [Polytolypa hystricis UAMH7299]|uniref:Protein-ribulosamine 3-kinase n=1 Tax=Polytolypa hystricis (strain UAMH7299) TaxID=1447883 RepID=A0A2B7YQM5_POLH7|nr:hypothetical protein AJ80_02798 [Polytolypa hystricis UAMH7299]